MQTGRPLSLGWRTSDSSFLPPVVKLSCASRWWRSPASQSTCWASVRAGPSSASVHAAPRPWPPKICRSTSRVPPAAVSSPQHQTDPWKLGQTARHRPARVNRRLAAPRFEHRWHHVKSTGSITCPVVSDHNKEHNILVQIIHYI